MDNTSNEMPWVSFYLQDEQFAVSTKYVREMVAMPKAIKIPKTPDYIRGVINLRGQTIPIMDLRVKLGMTSLIAETDQLISLMNDREEDHKNWIAELEKSVREKRDFKLTTDPNKCKFGKWYNGFKTDSRVLENLLKKFNRPHKKIHAIAKEVEQEVAGNNFEAAFTIIRETRDNELTEMVDLFDEVRSFLKDSSREIAVVLEYENIDMIISVDSVETVEKIGREEVEKLSDVVNTVDNEFVAGVGKREKVDKMIQLIDVKKLMQKENNLLQKI